MFFFRCLLVLCLFCCCQSAMAEAPRLQVVVLTADWCTWCKKFEAEVLPIWKDKGWPVGAAESDHIRIVETQTGPLPDLRVYRDGQLIVRHVGYMDRVEFRKWTQKHCPEWWQAPKQTTPPAESIPKQEPKEEPKWDYSSQILLGN